MTPALDCTECAIPGVRLVTLRRFADARGSFLESYNRQAFAAVGIQDDFVQDNHSVSQAGVVRGLHYQFREAQAQLVYVSSGRILDVVVDLRRGSPAFGTWASFELSAAHPTHLYMPPGCAHGFCVIDGPAAVHYKVTRYYDPTVEGGILWSDPDLGIPWPVKDAIIGARDAAYPRLRDVPVDRLPLW